ncbi:alpha/beta hydrolase, partial [Candidatus Saccharibacteria bacterium]|nr:alpha/beta hydrolase [Candidatus Saccharibacteria bacterium]
SSIRWYRQLYAQINRTGISRFRDALKPHDVLVINGDKDSVTPLGEQKKTAERIGAKVVVIPGVGHLAHYEKPSELADAVRRFLSQR